MADIKLDFQPDGYHLAQGGKFQFFLGYSGRPSRNDIDDLHYIVKGLGMSAERWQAKQDTLRPEFTGFDGVSDWILRQIEAEEKFTISAPEEQPPCRP